jgi:hypothetical protein
MSSGIAISNENETLIQARFTGKQTRVFHNPFSETRYVAQACLDHTSFKDDVWVLVPAWQKRFLPIINKIAPLHILFEVAALMPLFGAAELPAGGAIPLALLGILWVVAFAFLEFIAISVHHKVIAHAEPEGCFMGVNFYYIHDQWLNDFLEIDITNTQTMTAAGVDATRGTALLAIAQKRQMVKFKVMLYGTRWGNRYVTKRWFNCLTCFARFSCGIASAFFSFIYGCGASEVTHQIGLELWAVCMMCVMLEVAYGVWKAMYR